MEQITGTVKRLPWRWGLVLATGLMLLGWLFSTPEGLLGKADAIGYAVCHRIDARSFHVGERPFPLCARCTGMYLGALVGLAYQAVRVGRRIGFPPLRVGLVLGLMALAFLVDGLNSYLTLILQRGLLYTPQNWLRLFTGTGMGLVVAALVYPAFNQAAWRDWQDRPAVDSLRSLGVMVVLALGVNGLVLLNQPVLLYLLAVISAAGVLILLTMVFAMIWLMALRLENRYTRLGQMWAPLLAGFLLALMEIGLIDLGRYLLTGTWDGFHFG